VGSYRRREDLFQRPDHASRGQRQVDLDGQSFAIEVVEHVEQAEAATVAELVVHEVHRPDLVDRLAHRQRLDPITAAASRIARAATSSPPSSNARKSTCCRTKA